MTTTLWDRDTILQAVQTWPPDEQLALAQAIARQATTQLASSSSRGRPTLPQQPSWREMAGLAAVPGHAPPSDEDVAQWLDEHRREKYGAS